MGDAANSSDVNATAFTAPPYDTQMNKKQLSATGSVQRDELSEMTLVASLRAHRPWAAFLMIASLRTEGIAGYGSTLIDEDQATSPGLVAWSSPLVSTDLERKIRGGSSERGLTFDLFAWFNFVHRHRFVKLVQGDAELQTSQM
jgi:hypothetical protein